MPMKRVLAAAADFAKPYARAVKYARLYRIALRTAQRAGPARDSHPLPPIAFFFGCGRSGTTILGQIFQRHPEVRYFFEPYHLWAAIDPRTDMLGLYIKSRGEERCLMTGEMTNDEIAARFCALIRSRPVPRGLKAASTIIEKTPINALRLGFLATLAPDAKFVHIARDGIDVCRSIERLAVTNTYRIAGKPSLNQWWGVGDAKWRALVRDGTAAGYYADEVGSLRSNAQRGAYEWLLSLREAERWRSVFGGRFHEFTYEDLTKAPAEVMRSLCRFLDIAAPEQWLAESAELIQPARHNPGPPLALPPAMAADFNRLQVHYGFAGRAGARSLPLSEEDGRGEDRGGSGTSAIHPLPAPLPQREGDARAGASPR